MRETSFEEFINILAKGVEENLPEEFKGAKVEVCTTIKSNGMKCTSINIRIDSENMTPAIYVSEFYKDYVNNKKELEEIIKEVIDMRIKYRKEKNLDLDWISDFSKIKEKIIPTFMGLEENNKELMNIAPYVKILDMVMMFRIKLDIDTEDGSVGTILIKRELQNKLGVTTQELFETALQNVKGKFKCKSMFEVMKDMMGGSLPFGIDETPMYVISNKEMTFGATAVIDEEFMWDVYDKIGGDYIIIPSSVHELIVIPESEFETNPDFVNNMIKDVNRNQLEKKDWLSDHAYIFTKNNGLDIF